jgi:hypothetical protein
MTDLAAALVIGHALISVVATLSGGTAIADLLRSRANSLSDHKHVPLHMARRRLLASEGVGTVAFGAMRAVAVNRDYRKLYGLAPSLDVDSLREALQNAARPA